MGLSGGVDSSVSAALLKEAGYEVVGVFIKTWQPDFIKCAWPEERRDAMRVAAHLDIPFLTFDLEKEYKKAVGDYMISEYRAGRTPNPDVMCNKEIKFGAFLKKALAMGADYVATGHYARNLLSTDYFLLTGLDSAKDQSYFLWTLTQDQLKHILFPIGHLKKEQVRKLAKKYGLHTHEKKDSQGICFLGKVEMKDFLKHYIKEKRGDVLNELREVIGYHDGATFYTLGERHGFTITKKTPDDKPYYIVGKDVKKNILIVSQNPSQPPLIKGGERPNKIIIKNTNWISGFSPAGSQALEASYSCQVRYHGEFLPCQVKILKGDKAEITVLSGFANVSAGQSLVLYDKDVCLGGGIID